MTIFKKNANRPKIVNINKINKNGSKKPNDRGFVKKSGREF